MARRGARAVGSAGVVLDQDLDVGRPELAEREIGGVLHRLRDLSGIAGRRQREQQGDLDRTGAEDLAGYWAVRDRRMGRAIAEHDGAARGNKHGDKHGAEDAENAVRTGKSRPLHQSSPLPLQNAYNQ